MLLYISNTSALALYALILLDLPTGSIQLNLLSFVRDATIICISYLMKCRGFTPPRTGFVFLFG